MLEPALGHELKPDADAEKGLAAPLHGLLERLDHAWHVLEPPLAIGKGADAGKHDALGVRHVLGPRRHLDGEVGPLLARRALEGLGGGVEVAGAVIDDGDVHGLQGAGNSPMTPSASPLVLGVGMPALPGRSGGALSRGRPRSSRGSHDRKKASSASSRPAPIAVPICL